jgi:Protein of unknown function (DUF3592)
MSFPGQGREGGWQPDDMGLSGGMLDYLPRNYDLFLSNIPLPAMSSRSTPFLAGAFLSSVFLVVGMICSFFFLPKLIRWAEADTWPQVPGEIVSGEIVSASSQRGGRTVRPNLVWFYEWEGIERRGEGYGLIAVTTSDHSFANRVVAEHPPGTKVEVHVNPSAPDESYLERDPAWHVMLLLVPPVFAMLGLIGGFFTFAGWQGWFSENTRNPFGRLMRKALETFLRPKVAKSFFVAIFAFICLGLVWWSLWSNTWIGHALAVFIVYSLWQAMRVRK